jgi:hypothetical protein
MNSNSLSSNLNGFTFKQFKRNYPGNYTINFAHSLSSFNDFQIKNYTNFYLTNDYKISDIFDFDTTPLKASSIHTPILWGSGYLSFSGIDSEAYALANRYHESKNYGVAIIGETESSLSIDILDNNICNIYHTKNYQKFFLVVDDTNSLVFVKQNLLSTDPMVVKPQDFHYLFSENGNLFYLFKKTSTGTNIVTVVDGEPLVTPVLNNNTSYINWFFKIEKSIYSYPTKNLNTSFITYDTNNMLDKDKSDFELSNNLLLHKKISSDVTDVIILKNQLLQNNIYSSSNNLLSGFNKNIFVNELREYTSIGNSIDSETSEALDLNYVFYNKPYKIVTGSNIFYSSSSIEPFTQLNINDTKFIEAGAFPYLTPEFSDRVYHLSNDTNNYDNGQHLLCTWLSGSPFLNNSVWVDRYYYPNLIEKSEALAGSSTLSITYDDYIEVLVNSNSQKKENIKIQKFFDKKSDLVFTPNQKYNYERISQIGVESLSSNYSYCQTTLSAYPTNYFKDINTSGEVSVAFTFFGDDSSWTIQSDRGYIDSGISIIKTNNKITITCKFYDATTRDFSGEWFSFSKTLDIKSLKTNNLCVSVDVKLGIGYFFFNNEIVYNFTLPQYQLLGKDIIHGDFKYIKEQTYDLLYDEINGISNVFINDLYITPERAFLIFTLNSNGIDDIYITLPCGMRNSVDDIAYLNSVCGTSTFKSNYIDIELKNIGITDDSIINDLKLIISDIGEKNLPASTTINDIKFNDYRKMKPNADTITVPPYALVYNGNLITYNGIVIISTP